MHYILNCMLVFTSVEDKIQILSNFPNKFIQQLD